MHYTVGMAKIFITLAALSGMLAVAFGAFGAVAASATVVAPAARA